MATNVVFCVVTQVGHLIKLIPYAAWVTLNQLKKTKQELQFTS